MAGFNDKTDNRFMSGMRKKGAESMRLGKYYQNEAKGKKKRISKGTPKEVRRNWQRAHGKSWNKKPKAE